MVSGVTPYPRHDYDGFGASGTSDATVVRAVSQLLIARCVQIVCGAPCGEAGDPVAHEAVARRRRHRGVSCFREGGVRGGAIAVRGHTGVDRLVGATDRCCRPTS